MPPHLTGWTQPSASFNNPNMENDDFPFPPISGTTKGMSYTVDGTGNTDERKLKGLGDGIKIIQ